ncbi:MAG: hypothetical protein B7Y88_01165 [Sphingomonadales bacterium 32-64-17]|nr:MAG: hypothetical protein B7Y88_01165 [Sphingomonadales bacterium 32-64-17]
MSQKSVLIVDDDTELRVLIAEYLGEHGFVVRQAPGAAGMREQMRAEKFDLIVLDLMMPGEDGLSALRSLGDVRPPVIMLSAMGADVDRIVGLELGADDYVAKPCNPRELLARIRAVLRRVEGEQKIAAPTMLCFGRWQMTIDAHELRAPGGAAVELTTREWRLLRALAEARRRVLTRDELMSRVGGDDSDAFDRAIDIAISRLRRKLAEYDSAELIRTVRGEGYALALDVTQG